MITNIAPYGKFKPYIPLLYIPAGKAGQMGIQLTLNLTSLTITH